MASVNCYLPDALKRQFEDEMPADVAFSEILRMGVIAALQEQRQAQALRQGFAEYVLGPDGEYDDDEPDPSEVLIDVAALGGDVDAQANSFVWTDDDSDGPDPAA